MGVEVRQEYVPLAGEFHRRRVGDPGGEGPGPVPGVCGDREVAPRCCSASSLPRRIRPTAPGRHPRAHHQCHLAVRQLVIQDSRSHIPAAAAPVDPATRSVRLPLDVRSCRIDGVAYLHIYTLAWVSLALTKIARSHLVVVIRDAPNAEYLRLPVGVITARSGYR